MFNDNDDFEDDGSLITAHEWAAGAFVLIVILGGLVAAIFR